MRLLPASLLVSLLTVAACGPAPAGIVVGDPGDERPNYHDFGRVPWGTILHHTFELRNTDPEPVTILDAQGPCRCTRLQSIQYVAEDGEIVRGNPRATDGILVLPPGRVAEMRIEVDSSKVGQPNLDRLEIMRLRTTSPNTPYPTFEMHLLAEKLFQVTPQTVSLADIPVSTGGAGLVDIITGRPGSEARIDGIVQQGEHVEARLEEALIGNERTWRVHLPVPGGMEYGPFRDMVVLEGSTPESTERIEIEVFARVVEDVVIQPEQIVLGALRAGEARTVEAELKALVPGMRVGIEETTVSGALADHARVEFEAVGADATGRSNLWKLRVHVDGDLPAGRHEGELRVTLDDSQYPELRASLLASVR